MEVLAFAAQTQGMSGVATAQVGSAVLPEGRRIVPPWPCMMADINSDADIRGRRRLLRTAEGNSGTAVHTFIMQLLILLCSLMFSVAVPRLWSYSLACSSATYRALWRYSLARPPFIRVVVSFSDPTTPASTWPCWTQVLDGDGSLRSVFHRRLVWHPLWCSRVRRVLGVLPG
eukprot:TRINITY_DN18216_c0_g1_i1.p1 TRINITY_DN18216_c0_g1~~TRINITY_DN18216_c0_g1_i1.p1  ORF type:complete len:173 (+),score=5.56 TRINITY_DN18216_c0_g1_i1:216-734(+)